MARLAQVLVAIVTLLALPAGAYVTGALIGPPPRAADPPAEVPAETTPATPAGRSDDAPAQPSGGTAADTSGAAQAVAQAAAPAGAAAEQDAQPRPVRGRSAPGVDRADRSPTGKARGDGADRARRGAGDALPSPARAAQAGRPAKAALAAKVPQTEKTPPGLVGAADRAGPGGGSVPGPPPGRGPS